jgi:hypothetical protein
MHHPTLSVVLLAVLLTACNVRPSNEREITRDEYGDRWPFTVERGILSCTDNAVVLTTGGTAYAVNGQARTRGYAPTEPIWREATLSLSVSPVARLPVETRQQIFRATVGCEDEGNDEAERRLPVTPGNIEKHLALASQLTDTCKAGVRKQHALTADEHERIGNEGVAHSWPPLTPTRVNIGPIIDDGLQLCR